MSIDVRIFDRDAVGRIDPDAWDRLAETALAPNPFYERWHLLAALQYLDPKLSVSVVTAYQDERLVCLFPVCLVNKLWLFKYLTLWEFRDCRVSDVLCEPGIDLADILLRVMRHFDVSVLVSPAHGVQGFASLPGTWSHSTPRTRRAVKSGRSWEDYERQMPRKHRKENQRVFTRLMRQADVRYERGLCELSTTWLPRYCDLESRSWKAEDGRVIAAEPARLSYFAEALRMGEQGGKIEFQSLSKGGTTIAMAFRFQTRGRGYEVKTAFDEAYRQLYPGVVMELTTLKEVSSSGLELVDSCASRNPVVERLWPDRIAFFRTVVFARTVSGLVAALVYKAGKALDREGTRARSGRQGEKARSSLRRWRRRQ